MIRQQMRSKLNGGASGEGSVVVAIVVVAVLTFRVPCCSVSCSYAGLTLNVKGILVSISTVSPRI